MKLKIFLLILTSVCAFSAQGRDLMRIQRFSVVDGLPASRISDIVEDRDGVVWFSTWNGLCSWSQGKLTSTVSTREGRRFGRIQRMQALTDGCLLLVDDSQMEVSFDPKTGEEKPLDDSHKMIPRRAPITTNIDYYEDDSGFNIIRKGVVYHISYDEGMRTERQLHTIYEDRSGQIWMDFNNSLYRIWFEPSPFFYFRHWPGNNRVSFRSTVRALGTTSNGGLLAASRNYCLYGLNDSVIQVPYPGNVYEIVEDRDKRVWLALRKKGLYVWSSDKGIRPALDNLIDAGLSDIFSLELMPNQSILWAGTWGDGIRIVDISGETPVLRYTLCNDSLKSIHTFISLSNGLVGACSTRGLHLFSSAGVPIMVVGSELNVLSAVEMPDGRVLMGTMGRGLFWMGENGTFYQDREINIDDRISTMYLTRNNMLWLVSDTRLYRYDPRTRLVDKLDDTDFGEQIAFAECAITSSHDSLLYIGASSGMLEINVNEIDDYILARRARISHERFEKALIYILMIVGGLLLLGLFVALIVSWTSYRTRGKMPMAISEEDAPRSEEDQKFVDDLTALLNEMVGQQDVTISHIAARMGMPRNNLFARCSDVLHSSPAVLLQDLRIKYAKDLLRQGDLSVKDVAFRVGFNDPKYFSKVFKAKTGVPPSQVGQDTDFDAVDIEN